MAKYENENKGEGSMQCEGFRRKGGAFSFGSPSWKQCEEKATIYITVIQNGVEEKMPACPTCWKEAIEKESVEKEITITKTEPI